MGTSYVLPVRLSVIVSVSAIRKQECRGRAHVGTAPARVLSPCRDQSLTTGWDPRLRGSCLPPTGPGLRFDNARCRTAATVDQPDACGTGRTAEPRPSDPF